MGVDRVDDRRDAWVERSSRTVGINGKNGKQLRWALGADGSRVESVWLFEIAAHFGRGAGRPQGSPLPTEGKSGV